VLDTYTAAVVSPTVLLTAAHCIDAANHPGYLYGVFTGDDASVYPNLAALEPQLRTVASVHPHPQYSTNLPFYGDIGVVVMSAPLPITPIPMQLDALDTTVVGKAAQIIGYGQIVYNTYNAKRFEAMTSVGALDSDTILVGDAAKHACLGDSGGPAIVNGKLVGVDSYGPVGCNGPAHYRRVDTFKPFIEQYVPPPSGGGDPTGDPTGDGEMTVSEDSGCNTASGGGLPVALTFVALGMKRRRRRR
jgi:secreted trypsin-like serine protease